MFSRPPSHRHRHRHRSSAASALVTVVSLRGKAGHDERAPLRSGGQGYLSGAAAYPDRAARHSLYQPGHLPEREIVTGIGPVAVRCPRVRDRVGGGAERIRFSSALLPPYARQSKNCSKAVFRFPNRALPLANQAPRTESQPIHQTQQLPRSALKDAVLSAEARGNN
jgi:hypothetical protein